MDTLFFIASKLVGWLIRADTWLLLLSAATTLALLRDRPRRALRRSLALLSLCLILGLLPVGDFLLRPLEHRYPPAPELPEIDGIAILGGSEDASGTAYWGQVQFRDGAERFIAAASLAERFPDATLLFAGGDGRLRGLVQDAPSEASAAGQFFSELGLSPDRILLEGQSRNTAENAQFGHALAQPGPDETWVLVTSAFHMPRAIRSFEAAGWPTMIPWPVDQRTAEPTNEFGWNLVGHIANLNIAIKEYIGLLAYGLTGR